MPDGHVASGTQAILAALRVGELDVIGRLIGSSNHAMVVRVRPAGTQLMARSASAPEPAGHDEAESDEAELDAAADDGAEDDGAEDDESAVVELAPGELLAVWKPTRGEQPLFDFPVGTLTRREVATFLVSEATGWGIVPPTLLRDGPYGEGMLQQWIEVDGSVDVVQLVVDADPRLRRVAILDAIVNNTDRKGGHLLPIRGGHIHAVDHGVTFSTAPKLRTLLWAWAGDPLEPEELEIVAHVRLELEGELGNALRELLFAPEVDATIDRVDALVTSGVFPGPNPNWPAIPWPPF